MADFGASAMPNIESLTLSHSDSDIDDLFASPTRTAKKLASKNPSELSNSIVHDNLSREPPVNPDTDGEEVREAVLRRELAGIRSINEVIECVVASLDRARGNMDAVSRTVNNASALLNTWTRILSQTEHNQRLILNPSWQGASQDLSDMENESTLRRQEKERRQMEEQQRRETSARKAEEDERRKEEVVRGKGSRGMRGRGRGTGRAASTGYVGVGGQGGRGVSRGGGTTPGRSSSGIGRGLSGRARGRAIS